MLTTCFVHQLALWQKIKWINEKSLIEENLMKAHFCRVRGKEGKNQWLVRYPRPSKSEKLLQP